MMDCYNLPFMHCVQTGQMIGVFAGGICHIVGFVMLSLILSYLFGYKTRFTSLE